MATANDEIQDALIRHAVGLERLGDASARRIIASLRRADARIVERLASGYEPDSTRAQQRDLLDQIRAILDAVYTDEMGRLRIDLEDLATYEAEFLQDTVNRVVPNLGFSLPGADTLHAAVYSRPFQGKLLKDLFKDMPADAYERLRREITQGFIEGRSNEDMIRAIRGTRAQGYKDGINGVNQRAAEVTVKTAVAHVSNAARDRAYQTNARFLRGIQWVSVLDTRTTLICASRDGKIYKVDKGPRPPAHPRCRSTTTPVLKSQGDLPQERLSEVERAKLTGQPPEDLTYGAWLRRQPVSVQDDVLGQKKAILFRKGELPIDRFTRADGREYTLDELKRRNAAAWDASGLN